MSFLFPPETAEVAPPAPQNPWGYRVIDLVAEALSATPAQIGVIGTVGGLEIGSELNKEALRRRTGNLLEVLERAGLQELPLNLSPNKPDVPDQGWMEAFLTLAGDASSDLERETWARLLVLELGEPRTVSRRTLHFLHQMDLWELKSFGDYCAFAFAFESGWRFMFEGDHVRREIWSYGRESDLSQHWIEVGLLAREVSTLSLHRLAGLPLVYRSSRWEVKAVDAESSESCEPIRYRKFTALGQQIAATLVAKTFNGYARNVLKNLQDHHRVIFSSIQPPDSSDKA